MGTAQRSSLRPKDAAAFLGVAKSTLWRWAAERDDFPKARRLSVRCTVFDAAELAAWRDAQMSGEMPSAPAIKAPVIAKARPVLAQVAAQ